MSLPSDQNIDASLLSETSRKMLELRETVLEEWKKRVRSSVKESRELREPVFIDTIPPFYDNIAQAISPDYPRATAVEGSSVAYAHGSERAKMSNYDLEHLILEYQTFKSSLFQVLTANNVALNKEEIGIINTSIDEAIRDAVMAFSTMVAQMREQFIAALTHDMRNPLHTASMAVELIALTSNTSRIKELARRASDNLGRLDKMIQTMLDTMVFHRGQTLRLDLSCFDIMEVIEEVTHFFEEKDGVRCEVMGKQAYGWWNQEALYRSLENLIGNAIKYGDLRRPIRIAVATSHEMLSLSVHNEGMPIPIEEQEGVFQAFRRTEGASRGDKQGWGVGLPYVRAVVESLGGEVIVDSTHERGTTFTINIPLDARPFQNMPNAGSAEHQ